MKWTISSILIFILLSTNFIAAREASEKLTLDQCLRLASKNNPSLRQSAIALDQARLSKKQSYSNLYPSAGISAGTSTSDNSQPGSVWQSQWSIQGSVEQNIYRPGLYSGIQQAKVNERISEISNEDLQTQIRLSVENDYYQILTSYALIAVYNENIQTALENLEKIRMMYKVGARTESDVLKAEVQKGDFEALLIFEQERLQNFKRSLNTIMGRSPEINFEVEIIPDEIENIPDIEAAKTILLEKNLEYQLLKQNYKSREIALKISREAYLPSLSGYYSHSESSNWADNPTLTSNQVGIRASIELFSGFYKNQDVQKEKLNVEKARIELEAKERELTAQLTNLYASLQTYNNLIAIDDKNVE
ncbi:TolC family protein [candidate division KSB1 bacterium]|nr:TolC family protein [candidate division KSB1 bacterium]